MVVATCRSAANWRSVQIAAVCCDGLSGWPSAFARQDQFDFIRGFAGTDHSGQLREDCRRSFSIGARAENLCDGLAHGSSTCLAWRRTTDLTFLRARGIDQWSQPNPRTTIVDRTFFKVRMNVARPPQHGVVARLRCSRIDAVTRSDNTANKER
jgi:hypothetical protein